MAVFTNYTRIAVALSVIFFVSSIASGFVIDGQLGDWGVTPFASWTSDSAAAQIVDNWGDGAGQTGVYPHGGEVFDLEAGYASYDSANLYVAVVTSLPADGVNDPYGRPHHIMPGDFAISLNAVTGYTWGIIGSGPLIGTVVHNPAWSLPDGSIGIPANGPSTLSGGTQTGLASAVYADLGVLEPDGSHTYGVEMAIPWSLFGTEGPARSVQFHYSMTCGNDVLNWSMVVPPNVPEPSVIALMGIALASLPLRMCMRSRRTTA